MSANWCASLSNGSSISFKSLRYPTERYSAWNVMSKSMAEKVRELIVESGRPTTSDSIGLTMLSASPSLSSKIVNASFGFPSYRSTAPRVDLRGVGPLGRQREQRSLGTERLCQVNHPQGAAVEL